MKFDSLNNFESKKPALKKIFEKNFPSINEQPIQGISFEIGNSDETPIIETRSDLNRIVFSSNSNKSSIGITNDSLTHSIQGADYINFNSFKENQKMILESFDKLDLESLNRVAVRKTNIIEFSLKQDSDANAIEVAEFVLSQELMSDTMNIPNNKFVSQCIKTLRFQNEHYNLLLNYGLVGATNAQTKNHILVDIDLFLEENVLKENLFNEFEKINSEVFNIFIWCMSAESIDYLKSEGE